MLESFSNIVKETNPKLVNLHKHKSIHTNINTGTSKYNNYYYYASIPNKFGCMNLHWRCSSILSSSHRKHQQICYKIQDKGTTPKPKVKINYDQPETPRKEQAS